MRVAGVLSLSACGGVLGLHFCLDKVFFFSFFTLLRCHMDISLRKEQRNRKPASNVKSHDWQAPEVIFVTPLALNSRNSTCAVTTDWNRLFDFWSLAEWPLLHAVISKGTCSLVSHYMPRSYRSRGGVKYC